MQHLECENCGESFPRGETFTVMGHILCQACAEAALENAENVPEDAIAQNVDPTVCCFCGKDRGDEEHALMASLPSCETCTHSFYHRPFPVWLKISAVALAGIVLFSLAWNWRFARAYSNMKRVESTLAEGDIHRSASLSESIADDVPEVVFLRGMAEFHRGLAYLSEDRSSEALDRFQAAKAHSVGAPEFINEIDIYILMAEEGVYFENAEYDKFLETAQKLVERLPQEPSMLGGVASAYACKFAETGDESFREQSLKYLEMAQQADNTGDFAEYEMRILHRLNTREIITSEEFYDRFPGGWQAPEEGP